MNERSSLDIPGTEIYVGVVGGFYQSDWHSFASTRRPGVGREQVLIRVTVTRFLESAPIRPGCSLARSLACSRKGRTKNPYLYFDASTCQIIPCYLSSRLYFDLFEKPRG